LPRDRVCQLALVSGSFTEALTAALRERQVHGLVLIFRRGEMEEVSAQSDVLSAFLNLPIRLVPYDDDASPEQMAIIMREAIKDLCQDYATIEVNIGAADKVQAVSGLLAAMAHGLPCFDVINGQIVPLPTPPSGLRVGLSEEKLSILAALWETGGKVEGLEKLSKRTGMSRALLSYHIRGSERTPGLEALGFVKVSRVGRRTSVELTPLGRLVAASVG